MDPNMVSITKPTRERSRRIEAHSVGDKCFEKSALNFDHLYASTVKNSGENFKFSEVKQIKELLVLHLDLIQQQSEEIQAKDKLIAALREENELVSNSCVSLVPLNSKFPHLFVGIFSKF